jgi:hypothetical protein
MIHFRSVTHLVLMFGILFAVEASEAQSTKKPPRIKEPAWFVALPKDKGNLMACGKAEARDMQLAIDKAVVAARGALASQVESSWQKFLEALRKEMPNCGTPILGSTEVALANTKIRQQKTVKRKKIYTAFVLVSWPNASLDAALLARAQEDAEWYGRVKGTKAVIGMPGR